MNELENLFDFQLQKNTIEQQNNPFIVLQKTFLKHKPISFFYISFMGFYILSILSQYSIISIFPNFFHFTNRYPLFESLFLFFIIYYYSKIILIDNFKNGYIKNNDYQIIQNRGIFLFLFGLFFFTIHYFLFSYISDNFLKAVFSLFTIPFIFYPISLGLNAISLSVSKLKNSSKFKKNSFSFFKK